MLNKNNKINNFESVHQIALRYIEEKLNVPYEVKIFEKIKKIWFEINGDLVKTHTFPFTLKDETLIVKVSNPPLLFYLNSTKSEYINKINEFLKQKVIKNIIYKISDLPNKDLDEKLSNSLIDKIKNQVKEEKIRLYEINNIEIPKDVMVSIDDFIRSLNIRDNNLSEKIKSATCTIYKVMQYKKRHGYVECVICSTLFKPSNKTNDFENICEYCNLKLTHNLKKSYEHIVKNPWENYETHALKYPDITYKEFEYLKNKELKKIKLEVENLLKKYVMTEKIEDFKELDYKVRYVMSLHEEKNYFEIKEFGEVYLNKIAQVLGVNTKNIFARGNIINKLSF